MSGIWMALIIVGAVGLVAGLMLAVASALLSMPSDERADKIREILPGANCGGCGYSGCDAYATAVADGSAEPNLCAPGGAAVATAIGELLGKEVVVQERRAVVRCTGCEEHAVTPAHYHNVNRCVEAARLFGGAKSCSFGCLGLGDCVAACPYGAIRMEHGLARVDERLCTGCGVCTVTCPKQLITLLPHTAAVLCQNRDKAARTRPVCDTGCIACSKCVKTCPVNAISVEDNLARIDPAKCVSCGKCVSACPVGCIEIKN